FVAPSPFSRSAAVVLNLGSTSGGAGRSPVSWGIKEAARRRPLGDLGRTGDIVMASIVLADDDEDLRAIYGPFLRSAGHTVWEATGGLEALELVRKHRPGLLILDVWMPGFNGFEVLEALRHDPASTGLKVMMLSNL